MRRHKALPAFVAVLVLVAAGLVAITGLPGSSPAVAEAQAVGMQARLDQVIRILDKDPGPEAVGGALNDALEILYGGLRPLPTAELLPQTEAADQAVGEAERALAAALDKFVQRGKSNEVKGQAVDLKLFIEQLNEVATAVGEITRQCGPGMPLNEPPCDQLLPLLDEETGQEHVPGRPGPTGQIDPAGVITAGFTVKLRSPYVPPWWVTQTWQEDVRVTEPIADGECAVIFKETTGLMLRLRLARIIVVSDPWVSVFGVPRGTAIPIWTLELVPAEYGKEWNICNTGGAITKTVTQRVVQDVPLKYFWRFYPKDP